MWSASTCHVNVHACYGMPFCRTRISLELVENRLLPDVRNRMVSQGADPAFLGHEDFARFLATEMPRWAEAVKQSGTKQD